MEQADYETLLAATARGEALATAQFVTHFSPQLLRTITQWLGRSDLRMRLEAEDIAQVVFAEVLDHLIHRRDVYLPTPEAAGKLLSRCARNRLLDESRRAAAQRRRRPRGDLHEVETIPDRLPTPSARVRNGELIRLILAHLDEDEKDLVRLRTEGGDWREIAERLGSTPEAVRKRYERIFARLREAYAHWVE